MTAPLLSSIVRCGLASLGLNRPARGFIKTREARKKEGEIVSVVQEVLTSIRVVKAFAREDYEQHRLEAQSLESVDLALRARGLKSKLVVPLPEMQFLDI